jgi:hypothetical protein
VLFLNANCLYAQPSGLVNNFERFQQKGNVITSVLVCAPGVLEGELFNFFFFTALCAHQFHMGFHAVSPMKKECGLKSVRIFAAHIRVAH